MSKKKNPKKKNPKKNKSVGKKSVAKGAMSGSFVAAVVVATIIIIIVTPLVISIFTERDALQVEVGELGALDAQLSQIEQQNASLNEVIQQKDEEINSLEQKLETLGSELSTLEGRNDELLVVVEDKNVEIESLKGSLDKLLTDLSELQQQNASLNEVIKEKDEVIASLQEELGGLVSETPEQQVPEQVPEQALEQTSVLSVEELKDIVSFNAEWIVPEGATIYNATLALFGSIDYLPVVANAAMQDGRPGFQIGEKILIPSSGVVFVGSRDARGYYDSTDALTWGFPTQVVVVEGVTMWELAELFYGDASDWQMISGENGGISPAELVPGMTLLIP